jgi:hypothetical protein
VDTATALIGTQIAVSLTNLTISIVVLALTLRTTSPRAVLAYLRHARKARRRAPAPAVTDS